MEALGLSVRNAQQFASSHLPSFVSTHPLLTCVILLFFLRIRYIFHDSDSYTRLAYARLESVDRTGYRDRVVWITGASSGVGLSLSRVIASHGAHLIISARNESFLTQHAVELRATASSVTVLPFDLSDDFPSLEQTASRAVAIHGHLDYLFNNAGISMRETASNLEMEGVKRVLKINFLAPVAITRAVLPALKKSRGVIANTSTIASIIPTPLRSSYSAAKSALDKYFTSLSYEEDAVHVLHVHLGSTKTAIAHNAVVKDGKSFAKMDRNIENGLDPHRVALLIAAAAASRIEDAWIARPKELNAVRAAFYLPSLWNPLTKLMAKSYQRDVLQNAR